jgi:hypothetical protein
MITNKAEKLKKAISDKKYYEKHKSKCLERMKKYENAHKKELDLYRKQYRLKHEQEIKEYQIIYRKIHRVDLNRQRKFRYSKNINFRLGCALRNRIVKVLKRNPKAEITLSLLGCSLIQLKQHLESHFKDGMNWSNYGKWHVDHIRPCASFDLSKPEEQKKCFNYTNLQPLWAEENLSKGKK